MSLGIGWTAFQQLGGNSNAASGTMRNGPANSHLHKRKGRDENLAAPFSFEPSVPLQSWTAERPPGEKQVLRGQFAASLDSLRDPESRRGPIPSGNLVFCRQSWT